MEWQTIWQKMQTICNFYILSNARKDGRLLFCCALIEKLYAHGHKIYVYCQQSHEASQFNELLWTFKEESFIPHSIYLTNQNDTCTIEDCPIQIGCQEPAAVFNDVLILLTALPEVPHFYNRFSRVVEIVDTEPSTKDILRNHYQFYRSQNVDIKTHQI